MGCTYDVIEVKLKEREHAEKFVEMFNQILAEELYWEDCGLMEEDIEEEDDYYFISAEAEPLFCTYDMGRQLADVVFPFLKAVPEAELEASINITFNNCGDQLYLLFEYEDGLLKMKQYYSDCWFMSCPECEEDFVEIPCFEEDSDEPPVCPYCGAELDMQVDVDCWEIPLVDGEWQYPEGWDGYDLDDEED